MKVVLDTNCILQIVFPKACYKEAWDALLANKYTICVSNEILLEYREILERRFKDARFAENRGYGISSNIRMVVDGLHGEFAVLSGNALLLQSATQKKILDLPKEIDYKGTMIIIKIPAAIPYGFNLYNYTS